MAGGDRERDAEEDTRNQMMQNLFGDQSEDEDDADDDDDVVEVVDEDDGHQQQLQSPPQHHQELEDDEEDDARSHAHARHGGYHSEEVDGEAENGGEGEGESEGQVGMEEESEGEAHRADLDQGESGGDKVHSSPERELDDQRMEPDARGMDSEDEGYQQRTVSSRRRGVVASESEGSEDNYYADGAQEDEEPCQTRKQSSPMEEERDHEVVRDVFEKPVCPPLDLVVPFKQPPAEPDKMNVIKVSNIMGIDPKPFDPKTYVEEDAFVTDESGTKKRIRLEDNIVRWRTVRNADGTTSYESNARFVKWKDGSMQLLIGNEVLDISVHEAHHDQSHLFLRHGKGILQSQGRLLHKIWLSGIRGFTTGITVSTLDKYSGRDSQLTSGYPQVSIEDFLDVFDPNAAGMRMSFSSSETLVPRSQDADLPATVTTVKNPNPKVVYDEYNNERYSPGDPSKRGFAYFALNGGRFIYCVSSY
ncbi:unnamed protein product [Miscanthus lutarioriparius]|uniref:Uncharacterized protein n=1 Tax=Miscanthus lutarioriparius TaxID=422564 RepID=A0A811NCB5_9POAL|nr:unnamed protein product [Miscanthus lutarioriparius]